MALALAGCADDEDTVSDGDGDTSVDDAPVATEPDVATADDEEEASDAATDMDDAGDGLFPDVLEVAAERGADGTWRFDVTLSSPYDTPDRYADAWRVLGPDGAELGVRELAHDHQNEQPFVRSLTGVEIPADVTTVTVQGRDQRNGWGGQTVELVLP
ncbi:MAG: hypothetical protein AAGA90_21325 [Actinomycetota bacterium]